jgi:hypothetical protein
VPPPILFNGSVDLRSITFLSLKVGKDEDGVSSNEGSARVALRVIRAEGEVREAAPLLCGPQQQMACSRLVDRRRVKLRARRAVCCGRNRKAVQFGQGDEVALARVVQGSQALQVRLGGQCLLKVLGSQPMATGLVKHEWNILFFDSEIGESSSMRSIPMSMDLFLFKTKLYHYTILTILYHT